MKKVALFVLTTVLLFVLSKSDVSAQATCGDQQNGCITCTYIDNVGYSLSSSACKGGTHPPSTNLEAYCNALTFDGNVNREVSCIPDTAPNTFYYCVQATHVCSSCLEGSCPTGADLKSDNNACTTVCQNTAPQACTGTCRTSCQGSETIDNGGSCVTQGQICCKASAGNPAGCAAQGGSCKATCGAGESGGTSNFCAAPTNKCCYPDAQANPGPVVNVNLQGTCGNTNEIDTAIGCIPIGDVNTFATFFLKWGLGIAGGIGMIFLVYASFMIITSQGDPKRLQVGKELLMSAISGIIMLALSLFIFRILGINILGLF